MVTDFGRIMWLRLRGLRPRPAGVTRWLDSIGRWEPDIARWRERMAEVGAVPSFEESAWLIFADRSPSAADAILREGENNNELQQLFRDSVALAIATGYLIACERMSMDDASNGAAWMAKELFATVRQCARAEGSRPGCAELDIYNGLAAVSALPRGLAEMRWWFPSLERGR